MDDERLAPTFKNFSRHDIAKRSAHERTAASGTKQLLSRDSPQEIHEIAVQVGIAKFQPSESARPEVRQSFENGPPSCPFIESRRPREVRRPLAQGLARICRKANLASIVADPRWKRTLPNQ